MQGGWGDLIEHLWLCHPCYHKGGAKYDFNWHADTTTKPPPPPTPPPPPPPHDWEARPPTPRPPPPPQRTFDPKDYVESKCGEFDSVTNNDSPISFSRSFTRTHAFSHLFSCAYTHTSGTWMLNNPKSCDSQCGVYSGQVSHIHPCESAVLLVFSSGAMRFGLLTADVPPARMCMQLQGTDVPLPALVKCACLLLLSLADDRDDTHSFSVTSLLLIHTTANVRVTVLFDALLLSVN